MIEAHQFDVYDPEDNVQIARILYEDSKWVPWVCSRKGFLAFTQ